MILFLIFITKFTDTFRYMENKIYSLTMYFILECQFYLNTNMCIYYYYRLFLFDKTLNGAYPETNIIFKTS